MSVVKHMDLKAMPTSIFLNGDDDEDVSPPGRFAHLMDFSPPPDVSPRSVDSDK